MPEEIICIETYGKQRVKDPQNGQQITAFKIGYTGVGRDVLLQLFGDKARDVSPNRASYHYVVLPSEVTCIGGNILLSINEAQRQALETLTRTTLRPQVYRWLDNAWHSFPSLRDADYTHSHTPPSVLPHNATAIFSAHEPLQDVSVLPSMKSQVVVKRVQHQPTDIPWWFIGGDTKPHKEALKRAGARWSVRRQEWYYRGHQLHPQIQQLAERLGWEMVEQVRNVSALSDTSSIQQPETPVSPSLQNNDNDVQGELCDVQSEVALESSLEHIRIQKPALLPVDGEPLDIIQQAVVEAKQHQWTHHVVASSRNTALLPISQRPIGELTGSISGGVYCYGFAAHDGVCIFLNLGGPRTAIEAIRAKLSKGDVINLTPYDAPAIELTAGEGNTGMYTAFLQHIPEAKFTSAILVHQLMMTPNYGGKSTTFIIRVDHTQCKAKLKDHVAKLVKVSVFDLWADYLYHTGQTAKLITNTRSGGGIDMLTVTLDCDAWTRLITSGIEQEIISLPAYS